MDKIFDGLTETEKEGISGYFREYTRRFQVDNCEILHTYIVRNRLISVNMSKLYILKGLGTF